MNPALWRDLDAWLEATVVRADDVLERALRHQEQSGVPSIAVSAAPGKLLHLLASVR